MSESIPARHLATLQRIAEGDTNAEIGRALLIGEETIKDRVKWLLRHYNARNRWHLVALAMRAGDIR